ncbi:hypothetical protein [Solemya velesiana gill symbiont]|uniref:hypothetical protein n=1 Tax=Solemya velesiana gill symbiont TaxID=1918948 RepID=UPI00108431DB|nr:hypothetical protein [Solemya velesiana gill symbiont]
MPSDINRLGLLRFVAPAVHQHDQLFSTSPKAEISNCEIIQVTNLETGEIEHHGLAKIEPTSAAQDVIEQLNGSDLNGHSMVVRQFVRRSPFRDRRINDPHPLPSDIEEKRQGNRRRPNLKVEILHAGSARFVVSNEQPIS